MANDGDGGDGTKPVTCHDHALKWVHAYAVGGGVLTGVPNPIPGGTTFALGAAETHVIYWIAKIYGEDLSLKDIAVVAGGLELVGFGLRAAALEVANLIPVVGWIAKPAIAVSAIEAIGNLIVVHFENKYPRKLFSKRDGGK